MDIENKKVINLETEVVTKNVDIDEYKRFKEILERGISDLSFSFRMVEGQLENIRRKLRENKNDLKE